MIRRNTWILLAVFAGLLAVTFYLQRSGKLTGQPESTPVPTQPALFGLDTGEITALKVEKNDGKSAAFRKTESGSWEVTQPPDRQDLAQTVGGVVAEITSWKVMTELSVAPPADNIGLSNPAYQIILTTANGQEQTIKVGDLTPTGTGYYISMDGSVPLVVSKFSVDQVINLLTEEPTSTPPPLVETEAPPPARTPTAQATSTP